VVTLRPFNTFGPRQSERAVIASIVRQTVDPRCKSIMVGDITTSRDFQYVSDTVRAFLAVAALGEPGKVYNAGSGHSTRIQTVANWMSLETNKPISSVSDRERPSSSEVRILRADAGKLRRMWEPRVSLLDGLMRTLEWWRGRPLRADTGYIV
jgi:UDP-glucose 4-epimerase